MYVCMCCYQSIYLQGYLYAAEESEQSVGPEQDALVAGQDIQDCDVWAGRLRLRSTR